MIGSDPAPLSTVAAGGHPRSADWSPGATRWPSRIATAALGLAAFTLALFTRADADLWGHLRFGLDLLETGDLTAADPYSFTQDKPWTNHEWLSELQMAWAYQLGGLTGLLVLKAALIWTTFALAWHALRGAALSARLLAMLVVVLGTIHMTVFARPQLWSFLAFALLCTVLTSPRRANRWWLPPLFAMWVNCHGGWIVGLGVLSAWAATQGWQSRADRPSWAWLVAASVGATLLNPYGVELWTFIATTVRMTRPIDEWRSLLHAPWLNWVPWGIAVAGTVWMWRRKAPHRLSAGVTLAMLAYASARVMRIESLFVLAAIILLGRSVADRWPARTPFRPPYRSSRPYISVLAACILLLATSSVSVSGWRQAAACAPIEGSWAPDLEAMVALGHAGPGRVVTPFNWGQYAIWHLAPRLRVSMDGRRETVYSERRLSEASAIMAGQPAGLAALGAWNVEYVWLPASSTSTAAWLVAEGYRLDVQTPRSAVAVRADLPTLPAAPPPGTVRPCFPG